VRLLTMLFPVAAHANEVALEMCGRGVVTVLDVKPPSACRGDIAVRRGRGANCCGSVLDKDAIACCWEVS